MRWQMLIVRDSNGGIKSRRPNKMYTHAWHKDNFEIDVHLFFSISEQKNITKELQNFVITFHCL